MTKGYFENASFKIQGSVVYKREAKALFFSSIVLVVVVIITFPAVPPSGKKDERKKEERSRGKSFPLLGVSRF